MGLDMHLERYTRNLHGSIQVSVERDSRAEHGIDNSRISGICEEVGYWRGADRIHDWFCDAFDTGYVSNVTLIVPRKVLQRLLDDVIYALRGGRKDRAEAFCLADPHCDEGGLREDLRYTRNLLTKVLAQRGEGYFIYTAEG